MVVVVVVVVGGGGHHCSYGGGGRWSLGGMVMGGGCVWGWRAGDGVVVRRVAVMLWRERQAGRRTVRQQGSLRERALVVTGARSALKHPAH